MRIPSRLKIRFAIGLIFLGLVHGPAALASTSVPLTSDQIGKQIQAALPQLLGSGDVIGALRKADALNLPTPVIIAGDFSNFPGTPDAGLTQDIQSITQLTVGGAATLNMIWFPAARLGGVYTVQGNDNCQTWKTFTSDGKTALQTPTPGFFDNPICSLDGENAYLGLYKSQIVALLAQNFSQNAAVSSLRLFVDAWTGTGWDPGYVFTVNYNFPETNPKPLQTVCLSADCAGIVGAGLKAANLFNQSPTFAGLTGTTPAPDMTSFQNYTNANSTDCSNGVVPVDLRNGQPDQNGDVSGPVMGTFGADALLFPSRVDNVFIIGCIGHAVYPPHTQTQNLLIEFFAVTTGGLQPIDAVQFAPDYTKLQIISVLDNQ